MAAPEGTKYQVNFKLADGTLINIYAANGAELSLQLAHLKEIAPEITETSQAFGGGSNVAYAASALGATPVASGASIPEGHCKHGKLTYRESKPGAEKSWKVKKPINIPIVQVPAVPQ